jgi:hypothetical protein
MINEKEKEKKEKKFRTVFVMAAMRRRMYAITLLPSLVIFYLKSMCNDLRNIWPKILSDGNKVRRNLQRCEVIRKYRMVLLPNR